jgi:uroporphyrinogen-III decarboxylase
LGISSFVITEDEGSLSMSASTSDYSFLLRGLERAAAAKQGIPDRVPIFAQMHEFAMQAVGATPLDFYRDPELLVKASLDTMVAYGIDVPVLDYDVYNIEAEALGQAIVFSADHMPDVDRIHPLIRTRVDLDKIRTPDFETAGRCTNVVRMNRLFQGLLGVAPTLSFTAPFSLAANIRGIEALLDDIYSDPRFAHELFTRITEEVLAPWIHYLQKTCPKATAVCGSDATASLPIVSPQILKKWVAPYVLRLRELCGPAVYVPNWVGEQYLPDPTQMLDLKLSVCPDFVEGQDPDVAHIGPALYKRYAEEKSLPLVLGLGAGFLALNTPAEIERRLKDYIRVGGRNGRFMLYLCNLGATTPPENVRAAVAAAKRYGSYGR